MSHRTVVFLAILSSVLSSVAWVFQERAIHLLTPLAVASAQGILAGTVYAIHLIITRKRVPFAILMNHRRDLLEFTLLRGIIGSIVLAYALTMSESVKVMFLTKLEPYLVLFWMWLLTGARPSRYHLLLLFIHVLGAIALSTGGELRGGEGNLGDLLIVIALALFSFSYLHAARLSKELGAIHLNGVSTFIAGLVLLPLAIALSPAATWYPFSMGWANVLVLVLLFNVFGLTFWYVALRHIEPWLVSALRALGPVLAAPIAWLLTGQTLNTVQMVGAAVVLITSVILADDQRRERLRKLVVA